MVVRIRLVPVGKKSQPAYQIKVIESRKSRESGNFLERLGNWNPRQNKMELDQEGFQRWLKNGAQPSDSLKVRYNKPAVINALENLPAHRIKVQFPENDSNSDQTEGADAEANNFLVKDLKKKLKERNFWLIKGVLLDKWEKGLVEKFFKGKRFRIGRFFSSSVSRPGNVKFLGENEKITPALSPLNFEFSITLPKEVGPATIHTTKNGPVSILEVKKK